MTTAKNSKTTAEKNNPAVAELVRAARDKFKARVDELEAQRDRDREAVADAVETAMLCARHEATVQRWQTATGCKAPGEARVLTEAMLVEAKTENDPGPVVLPAKPAPSDEEIARDIAEASGGFNGGARWDGMAEATRRAWIAAVAKVIRPLLAARPTVEPFDLPAIEWVADTESGDGGFMTANGRLLSYSGWDAEDGRWSLEINGTAPTEPIARATVERAVALLTGHAVAKVEPDTNHPRVHCGACECCGPLPAHGKVDAEAPLIAAVVEAADRWTGDSDPDATVYETRAARLMRAVRSLRAHRATAPKVELVAPAPRFVVVERKGVGGRPASYEQSETSARNCAAACNREPSAFQADASVEGFPAYTHAVVDTQPVKPTDAKGPEQVSVEEIVGWIGHPSNSVQAAEFRRALTAHVGKVVAP